MLPTKLVAVDVLGFQHQLATTGHDADSVGVARQERDHHHAALLHLRVPPQLERQPAQVLVSGRDDAHSMRSDAHQGVDADLLLDDVGDFFGRGHERLSLGVE